ncbi:Hvo_1808 family surface protein [Halobium salinum]|uniref:Hvo_1808 family surface protein n=1 Tax=Halobium salinum TaxID=1364940 RepID=A0ABD5PBL5_9EURY|nr:Hvo_1808 family surface protein [Halobium salinum]
MQRRLAAVLLVCSVLLAGCSGTLTPPTAGGEPKKGPLLGEGWSYPDDPPEDRLGWEAGYWHNESVDVDQSDGLNASERRALVARTMARVERVRGLEFRKTVPVQVVSREEYRNNSPFGGGRSAAYEAWRNQVWEAALLVGEERNTSDVFAELYGGSVLGYYSPSGDRIVVISESATPRIDRATLAHELVHALQDQHFDVPGARTRDAAWAHQGVTEGDARYVESLYERRCAGGDGASENVTSGDDANATWNCVPRPESGAGGGGNPANRGVFLTIYVPYSDGPALVEDVRERGGWDAVNRMYANPPASTEQVIHPEAYPDERPVEVTVSDRSGEGWSRFDLRGQRATETMGEVTLFAMQYHNGLVERDLRTGGTPLSPYNYSDPASAGWAGDRLVPYRNADGENGYVYRITFDTERDAREFERAYRTLLTLQLGGEQVREAGGPGLVYRIPEDRAYGDAFRVYRDGDTVTIVNAPAVEELSEVHDPQ